MATGCVIGESLRPGAVFEPPGLRIRRITRLDLSDTVGPHQPPLWTVVDFEVDDREADGVAEALAGCLRAEGGWYADLRVGDQRVIVFAGTVYRYARGDTAVRAQARAHGRSVGVPEHQLDWQD
ncbi:hypothetical protein ABUW04_04825 [Streptacidiphilus sp. N1-10]|uniref:Uncharacterized protein n=1 Tax=Streptacidiphilus jeojiensis TaxID=3229225 RepID=A0ABV6XH57_9ACTN